MKRKLLTTIFLLAVLVTAQAQYSEHTVGGVIGSSQYVPVFGVKAADSNYHSQIIYPADSIAAMTDKYLRGITFYLKTPAAEAFDSRWQVRIGTTENETFATTLPLSNVNYTVVYEGTVDASGSTMAIVFDTPYDYRGGNLVVDISMLEHGTVETSCLFYGSLREGGSLMRCTGIAGRYTFMPKATFAYSEPVVEQREAENTTAVELCNGGTGETYQWHATLERSNGAEYDTVIYTIDMTSINVVGDDTTINFSLTMPRYLKGCADVEKLQMKIFQPKKHFVYDTICQGDVTYNGYGLSIDITGRGAGTTEYLTDEAYWDRIYTAQCYDTTYLELRINRTYKFMRMVNLCSSRLQTNDDNTLYYVYSGHRIDIPATTIDTQMTMYDTAYYSSVTGCDSTVIYQVKVSPSQLGDTVVTVNESQLPYTVMDLVFSISGTRSRTLYNQYGCDSTIRITLRLNPAYRDTTIVVGCGTYDWYVDGTLIATADHDTMASYWTTASDGMDSILYLRYRTGSINRADTVVTACESYWFKGVEYTRTAQVFDTVPGIGMECDTQYQWRININYPQYRSDSASVCDSLIWNGQTYYATTTAVYDYEANACPNADTLHLEVRYSSEGDTLVYAPQTYECYDSIYTASGQYTYVIPNRVGCDSVVTLTLYVTPHNTPLPQIYLYDGSVLILNHYPYGDMTRVEYDSIRWEHDGAAMSCHGDEYHLPNYAGLWGCYKAWVMIEGVWFPSNEVCIGNGIDAAESTIEYSMWPNPAVANGQLNISLQRCDGGVAEWQLYDLQGRKLASRTLQMGNNTIDCSIAKGSYLMRVVAADGSSSVKKLIVN